MTQTNQIKQLLQSKNLWDNSFSIRLNPNIRGQSISYFIYSSAGVPIYIAKFFDYFKGIPLPDSIDINRCKDPDDMIERLAEADDFMGDIDNASDQFYYQKRSFLRYVQVCSEEEIGFPRIVAVKENIIINSHYYSLLIEKAINGVTLEDYLKAQTFSRNRVAFAISFLHKMADIIQKFISHGIVHRDLSPDNIMISNQELVVIDPGMVKFKNRNTTKLGCIMGKENYASPEQYYGQAVYTDFTSDLYTVGLIAFEIISGFNPLELYITKGCSHPHEEIIKKFDRELEDTFFSDIDDSEQTRKLFLIIRKLLQTDKTYRFDNISSFQEALNTLKEEHEL